MFAGAAFVLQMSPAVANAERAAGDDYASQAIRAGDFAAAERRLKPISFTDRNDPARLINIATVYAATGRLPEAHAALQRVRGLDNEQLVLADGQVKSSRALARQMLSQFHAIRN